jgi:hypothetical protein
VADLTITPANVQTSARAKVTHGTAGAAVTAGQVVYLDPADKRFKLADSNSATAVAREAAGFTLHASAVGQPLAVHESGPLTIGATMTAGTIYTLSETPGGVQPAADLGSGEYTTVLGMATSTTVLDVKIQKSGVAL